jgi:hypothetical protein
MRDAIKLQFVIRIDKSILKAEEDFVWERHFYSKFLHFTHLVNEILMGHRFSA